MHHTRPIQVSFGAPSCFGTPPRIRTRRRIHTPGVAHGEFRSMDGGVEDGEDGVGGGQDGDFVS